MGVVGNDLYVGVVDLKVQPGVPGVPVSKFFPL